MKRFGGWGIRINFSGETAYNIRGKQGIELRTRSGVYVIGSQKPEDLKAALDQAIHRDL